MANTTPRISYLCLGTLSLFTLITSFFRISALLPVSRIMTNHSVTICNNSLQSFFNFFLALATNIYMMVSIRKSKGITPEDTDKKVERKQK